MTLRELDALFLRGRYAAPTTLRPATPAPAFFRTECFRSAYALYGRSRRRPAWPARIGCASIVPHERSQTGRFASGPPSHCARPLRRPLRAPAGGGSGIPRPGADLQKGQGTSGAALRLQWLTAAGAAAPPPRPRRWRHRLAALLIGAAAAAGCASFDSQQRQWIFQPTHKTWWAGAHDADGMQDVSIEFVPTHAAERSWLSFASDDAAAGPRPVKLHGLWMPQPDPRAGAALPARRALGRVRQRLPHPPHARAGFFGARHRLPRLRPEHATTLPSETMATRTPAPRGTGWRSIGPTRSATCSAIRSAARSRSSSRSDVDDASGLIVEGTFTSIRDVLGTMTWGWLPLGPLITQRFDAAEAIASVKTPVLVVHGSNDQLIRPELGRALFERATAPKRFVLVEGGSHHNTNAVGQAQYREVLADFFGLPTL